MLGWKSRLDSKDIIEDVDILFTHLHDYATTNQIVVNYKSNLCKVARLDYYPDKDGVVVFKKLKDWRISSYSVAEMLEFLDKYGTLIKDLKFEAVDGSMQKIINFAETCDASGVVWYTHIIVGDDSLPLVDILPKSPQQALCNPNIKTIL